MNRKRFLKNGFLASASLVWLPSVSARQGDPAALDGELVHEFVRMGHVDLAGVREMLDETPALLNASWDWGGGDFETALGGAAHMGHRDIATYLIGKGSRMDIFCAAMLGELDIVKAMVTTYPAILRSRGPHGISLLTHARKGGEQAEEVVAYLDAQGLKD